MKAIDEMVASAIARRKNWKRSNTEVSVRNNHLRVKLHGNVIYEIVGEAKFFSLCGYNTPTTRRRLAACGIYIKQKNFDPYFVRPDGEEIKINKNERYLI